MKPRTALTKAFGKALRQVRKARGLTQEDFGDISSRTYLSALERGVQSPTLDRLDVIVKAMKAHPLTVMALAYTELEGKGTEKLLDRIRAEIAELKKGH
jgi:transcriptional regulator with XRE-family HTH domain